MMPCLVVTGCGGAMGAVLKASGADPQIAEAIANSGIPPLLVPLAIASMLRLSQGSATASMMVAATMTLPLVEGLGLDPAFVALACAAGPVGFSHFNDSSSISSAGHRGSPSCPINSRSGP